MDTVLEILSYVGWVLVAIMILVFIHELGHFLFAKLFKMRVDRFSVGFPPNVLKRKVGDTEYVIGATPLGGYVKIAGMVDESMDTDFQASEPQEWEFRSKPVWQRIVVITAGVAFNFLLAVVVFSVLQYRMGEVYIPAENIESVFIAEGSFLYDMGLRTGDRIAQVNGKPLERAMDFSKPDELLADRLTITVDRDGVLRTFEAPEDIMTQLERAGGFFGLDFSPSLISFAEEGWPATGIGLRRGDRIVAIDSVEITFWAELTPVIRGSGGRAMEIQWERPDSLLSEEELPDGTRLLGAGDGVHRYGASVVARQTGPDEESYLAIGVEPPDSRLLEAELGSVRRDYSIAGAILAGTQQTWVSGKVVVTALSRVATGREDFRETMGGPVAIARETKRAAEQGYFWRIVAMLSITLGIVNILPVPALDGGHLVFLVYEGITRREPSLKLRMAMQQIGMIMLLVFMAFLIVNDILRL
jgi:regulator of sigma E protease